ncbi:carbon-nitrogen hydrolase family protein [Paenibacillus apiarius]|uniref:Carbon-nitrogen hydrolase family protein n=1 Tax=Paenibacillus apiarius TaxID=46240 RepID=A0ABT4DVY0_9BACL|nr:carbon-nitrogen hydrolase family protein [Paenibacillus apiarius]MCY9513236.1 carbon-nitrogen hydrolase family protein [Paenibacillus apiarius]MCY9521405.1 carbon-nitrogen hydrolase family protein [Paenibacillus apiarius]MCY9554449.1 carbon-nitrogen hydrolase family protein [Paenibacillus apiarius]MCY9560652.1 carbon-nitrogen hydrolase family protein [Paenibacillus apiarius]MCY9685097.1 carbon-nitrogen hydrolase family protein [Paenibacillus apiarius]
MKNRYIKVAAVQSAPPILFDKQSAMGKIENMTREAAGQGAHLIVFPEVFLPGYPRGLSFGTRVGSRNADGRRDWERYWASAMDIPGSETETFGELAKELGVYLVIGVVERDQEFSTGTLYNSMVYIGPDGNLLGKHRKLVPTGSERLLWGQGDGSTLTVIDTPFGRIGGLICWENYMPLARMAMYAQGIDIYLAPTADARDTWQATIRHIACEGRSFVISCNQFATKASYPADLACYEDLKEDADILSRGGSAIVGPLGEYVVKPLYNQEGILFATLDLSQVTQSRYDFDVAGHYSRPDVFQLIVNDKKQEVVRTAGMQY